MKPIALVLFLLAASPVWAVSLSTPGQIELEATLGPIGEHAEQVDYAGNRFIVGGDNGEVLVFAEQAGVWQEETRLHPWAGPGGIFGYSVAITSQFAAASNPHANSEDGEVYIYKLDQGNWVQDVRLAPLPNTNNDWFGSQIAMEGGWLLAGAPRPSFRTAPGVAYVYKHDGAAWGQHSILKAPGVTDTDFFGDALDISGNQLVIGAPYQVGGGAAYVFALEGNSWVFQSKLVAPLTTTESRFGETVAIDGDTIVVGDPGAGNAHVFEKSGASWSHELSIAPVGDYNGNVQRTVDVFGDFIAVGDPLGDMFGQNDGIVTLYHRQSAGWTLLEQLESPLTSDNDRFGLSLKLGDGSMVVTAYGQNGRAMVFSLGTSIPEPTTHVLMFLASAIAVLLRKQGAFLRRAA